VTDSERLRFLLDLRRSEITPTPAESKFVNSILDRGKVTFSIGQRNWLDKLIIKYRGELYA